MAWTANQSVYATLLKKAKAGDVGIKAGEVGFPFREAEVPNAKAIQTFFNKLQKVYVKYRGELDDFKSYNKKSKPHA